MIHGYGLTTIQFVFSRNLHFHHGESKKINNKTHIYSEIDAKKKLTRDYVRPYGGRICHLFVNMFVYLLHNR
jgi:hypothetical protein